jgi:hypothetical protein
MGMHWELEGNIMGTHWERGNNEKEKKILPSGPPKSLKEKRCKAP